MQVVATGVTVQSLEEMLVWLAATASGGGGGQQPDGYSHPGTVQDITSSTEQNWWRNQTTRSEGRFDHYFRHFWEFIGRDPGNMGDAYVRYGNQFRALMQNLTQRTGNVRYNFTFDARTVEFRSPVRNADLSEVGLPEWLPTGSVDVEMRYFAESSPGSYDKFDLSTTVWRLR